MFDKILDSNVSAIEFKKKNKTGVTETKDWFLFLQSCFVSLIALLVASFIACNFILVGMIHPEIMHPTIPCKPPYMPNKDSEKFKDAVNIDRKEGSVSSGESYWVKCASNDDNKDGNDGIEEKIFKNISPEVKHFYNEIRHKKQGEIYKTISSKNASTKGKWIKSVAETWAMTTLLVVMRSCIIFRTLFQSMHIIPKTFASQKTGGFIFLTLLLFSLGTQISLPGSPTSNMFTGILSAIGLDFLKLDTTTFFGIPLGINFFSIYNWGLFVIGILVATAVISYAFMIETENNTFRMILFGGLGGGYAAAVPLVTAFMSMDFLYYYLFMPILNSKARGVITCMLANDFSKIITFMFSVFIYLNANAYLDDLTSKIIFFMLFILNGRSLFKHLFSDKEKKEEQVAIGNCTMKQHLYKNMDFQKDISES